uniref:NmrA-like domain-containing protein n=1 Tax=Araucaria cunninghamii TaxID=56994 RepID=A0A0D6QYB6_ARACU
MGTPNPSRILIVGGTGYLGKNMVKASLAQGHPTYVLVRPDFAANIHKAQLLISFKQDGAQLVLGSFDDHESMVNAVKQVDVVISAMAEHQLLQQLKLVKAIKAAGNIKRFLPSEYGMDAGRMGHAMEPANVIFQHKMAVRRATEEAGIPFTYISANCFAGYFLAGLAQYNQFVPPLDKAVIYGQGNHKVIWVNEEDIGTYAVKTVDDPRTKNKIVYIRPPLNILSLREVVEIWEKLCGKVLVKPTVSEEQWLAKMHEDNQSMSFETKVAMAIFYHIFYKGELTNFDIDGITQLEATELYPEVDYTSVERYLTRFV